MLTAVVAASLAACGGGGGSDSASSSSSGPAVSTLSFPLQSASKTWAAKGISKNFTISGTCSGSGSRISGPASTAATFEGVAGLSSVTTISMTVSNCTPASIAQTSTTYYDSNYVERGFYSVGGNYGVFVTPPAIPATVTVGMTGIIGSEALYTSSTKAVSSGRMDFSYAVEAETSTTAVINLISRNYNASNVLTATEQDRYRIDASGTLTPVVYDIQESNGSTTHLVLTF